MVRRQRPSRAQTGRLVSSGKLRSNYSEDSEAKGDRYHVPVAPTNSEVDDDDTYEESRYYSDSDSEASGYTYGTYSDTSTYVTRVTFDPEVAYVEADDFDNYSVGTLQTSLIGGWFDNACGWLDRGPLVCADVNFAAQSDGSLLRESKQKAAAAIRKVKISDSLKKVAEQAAAANKNSSPEEKRSQRLERKGIVDIEQIKEDMKEAEAKKQKTKKSRSVESKTKAESTPESKKEGQKKDKSPTGSSKKSKKSSKADPDPGIETVDSGAATTKPRKQTISQTQGKSDARQQPGGSKAGTKQGSVSKKLDTEPTEFKESRDPEPTAFVERRSEDLATIPDLHLPESEDIHSVSANEAMNNSSIKMNGTDPGVGNQGNESITDLTNVTDEESELYPSSANQTDKSNRIPDNGDPVHVIDVLELDDDDSWTPGKWGWIVVLLRSHSGTLILSIFHLQALLKRTPAMILNVRSLTCGQKRRKNSCSPLMDNPLGVEPWRQTCSMTQELVSNSLD